MQHVATGRVAALDTCILPRVFAMGPGEHQVGAVACAASDSRSCVLGRSIVPHCATVAEAVSKGCSDAHASAQGAMGARAVEGTRVGNLQSSARALQQTEACEGGAQ
jgi:hypothetical protein